MVLLPFLGIALSPARFQQPTRILVSTAILRCEGGDFKDDKPRTEICKGVPGLFQILHADSFSMLQRPRIFTLSGAKATIQTKGESETKRDDLSLSITPTVRANGAITLDVDYTISHVSKDGSGQKVENKSEVTTVCTVLDGQTLVLRKGGDVIVLTPSVEKN